MLNTRPFGDHSIQIGSIPPERGKVIPSDQLIEQKIADQIERLMDNPEKSPLKSSELLEVIDALRKEKPVAKESSLFKGRGVSEPEIKKQVYLEHALNQYFNQDFSKPGPTGTKRHKNHDELLSRYLGSTRTLQLIKGNFEGKDLNRVMHALIKNFETKAQNIEKMRTELRAAGQKEKERELIEKQKDSFKTDLEVLGELRKRPTLKSAVIHLEAKMIEAAQSFMTKSEVEKMLSVEQKQSHVTLLANYQEPRMIEDKTKNKDRGILISNHPNPEIEAIPKGQSQKSIPQSILLSEDEINKILITLEDKVALEEAVREMTSPDVISENEPNELSDPAKTIIHLEDLPSFEEISKFSSPKIILNSLRKASKILVTELKTQSVKTTEVKDRFSERSGIPASINFYQPMPSAGVNLSKINQNRAVAETPLGADSLLKLIEVAAKQNKVLSDDIARQSQNLKTSPEIFMRVMAQFIGALRKELVPKSKTENQKKGRLLRGGPNNLKLNN